MGRTDKNDGASNKLIFLSLAVTIILCTCVAVAVFCLDLKRKEEISHLRNQVISFGEEVVFLRQQLEQQDNLLNKTATTVNNKITECCIGETPKLTQSKGVTPEEDEEYYYDNYDYDTEEEEDEDVDDTTAAAPLFQENVTPSQDKVIVDSNSTVSARPKRHLSQEDDTNMLDLRKDLLGFRQLFSLNRTASGDKRGSEMQHNSSYLPEYGQLLALMPLDKDQSLSKNSLVHLRHNRQRKKEKRESEVELMAPYDNTDIVAAHYGGDTRKYHIGRHRHYDGNDRMYHPSGVFKDWAASDWIESLGMNSYFKFYDGVVTVQNNGLYLVYAQIFYADFHDTSGYRIYRNDDIVAQCTTMTHSSNHVMKRNTCFTSIVLLLRSEDKLKLREIEGNRYTIFEPTKSFFGLVKLKNVNF